jgi:2-oxoglutarate dehydrogenase E1 component
VNRATLSRVIEGLTNFPPDFHLHPKLKNFVDRRREVAHDAPMDWATAEALSWGSLTLEGTPVRLSGQDVGRGTFSQRHSEFYDFEDGHQYVPLQHLAPDQARFEVVDSPLSEYAVMGFEFGYSLSSPETLTMWEAQFGDFVNGAQIVIDQFISSAETKWGQASGLVLLLPHGYEGQGPEHSSARMERFLQLCAENNMQIVSCTTPAQYFHVMRRQMRGGPENGPIRKPLVIFTPKSLLRHTKATSTVDELTQGGFEPILPDTGVADAKSIKRVLLCSGKVYYDLLQGREARKASHVAIIRVEQLYPFPCSGMRQLLETYPANAEIYWVQEEPRNMGAWIYMKSQLMALLEPSKRFVNYVGRPESAATSSGSLKRHEQEQAQVVEDAFAPTAVSRKPRRMKAVRKK